MKSETRNVLLKAYAQLHQIIEELYVAHDRAIENNDLPLYFLYCLFL